MLTLAFDTATDVATSALVWDGEVLGELRSRPVSVLEDVDALFRRGGVRPAQLEAIVVGTCFGGTPEIVVDGVTGYLADPWDADAFGNRLADVLCDPERARQMGAAGRKRLEARFTLDRQVQAYDALLGSLPSPRRASGSTTRPRYPLSQGERELDGRGL